MNNDRDYMSVERIKEIISSVKSLEYYSIQLLQIKNNKTTNYYANEIEINSKDFESYFKETCELMLDMDAFKNTDKIEEYNGEFSCGNIYELSVGHDLVNENYKRFLNAISDSNTERKNNTKWNAFVVNMELNDEENRVIRFISLKSPISTMRNKYIFDDGSYKLIKTPVLNLYNFFDVIMFNDKIYMFSPNSEKLFNMEKSYRIKCNKTITEIENKRIVSNIELFRNTALKGYNPRRFITFDRNRLNVLFDDKNRKKYLKKFNISITEDGLIDTNVEDNIDRLIKFLCNKALIDPLDNKPREVVGVKKWV